MLFYLIIIRPLKDILDLAQLFLNEILLAMVNICVFIIAIMDQHDVKESELKNHIGEAIIILFILFMSFSLVFMTLKWLVSLYSFYKLVKCLKTKGSLTISRVVKAMFTEENEAQENKKEKFNISTAQTRQKMISQPSPIVRLEQQGKRRGPLQRREMFQAKTQFFKNETANMSSQLNMPNLSQNQIFKMLNPSNYEEVNDFDYPRRPRRINIPKIRRNGRKTSHFT